MANRKKLTDTYISSLKTDKRIEIYDDTKGAGGLVLRATPTGHKSFAFRYWYQGQSRQYTIGRYGTWSLKDARDEVKELKKLIDRGIDPVQRKQTEREARPMTFGGVIERYKADHLQTLRESTRIDRLRRLKVIEKEIGAKRYVKDMKRGDIVGFLDNAKRRAPVNAQKLQVILSSMFNYAVDREWMKVNIAAGISVKRPQGKTEWENVAYDNEEIKKLWRIFSDHVEPVGSFFRFLMVTGQRAGETRLAEWKDIDLDKCTWTIPAENAKNKSEHHVPLSDKAIEILLELKQWTKGYVFESLVQPGQPITHPSKAAQRIKELTKRTKKKIDFNTHSLRTTFATRQAGLGTPPQVLSKLLNHKKSGAGSDITALYNRYDYDEEKRLAMQKWSRELHRILTGETAEIYVMKKSS